MEHTHSKLKIRKSSSAFVTDRLFLAPMTAADAAALFAYRSQPVVFRFQTWRPKDIQEAADFITAYCSSTPQQIGSWRQFGIYLKDGQKLIGDCGFCLTEKEQAKIGYTISPAFQRQKFGYEAVCGLITYLFKELEVHRITASTDPENSASISLLGKLGFQQEGHFVKSIKIRGKWKDDVLFALLKEDSPTF